MAKIGFVHPDLGIGGAERLVVDAAVGLQDLGHSVTVYTSHCDKSHCFDEVKSDVVDVTVYGDFLPSSFLGKFAIVCAMIRQLYLTLRLIVTGEINHYDFFVVDQLSMCVPLLSIFSKRTTRVLFYCHFPDQLMAKKGGLVKKLYRLPFNAIEEWTTGVSDQVVVNSHFTKSIFHKTFSSLSNIDPGVIYPCVDTTEEIPDLVGEESFLEFMGRSKFFLSVNRFERVKNVGLALNAYAVLLERLPAGVSRPKLILAGGFDPRVRENVEYLKELEAECQKLNLVHYTFRGKLVTMPRSTQVIFLPSVSTDVRNIALKTAELLLYTPTFEHFGIVPVESMLKHTPVLAINKGGPLESIVDYNGVNKDSATGFNRPNDANVWASTMLQYYNDFDSDLKMQMGKNGRKRVDQLFTRKEMSLAFQKYLDESRTSRRQKGYMYKALELWKIWLGAWVIILAIYWKISA